MPKTRKSHARATHDASPANRTPRAAKPKHRRRISDSTKSSIVAGAAILAAGTAATTAVMMRRQIGRLAAEAAEDAMAAGHRIGSLGSRIGSSLNRDRLGRLVTYAGFSRRRSRVSRLGVPIGIVGALLAAAGSAVFFLAPRLAAASEASPEREHANKDSSAISNSVRSIGNREEATAHAVR